MIKLMKRLCAIILVIFATALFAACNENTDAISDSQYLAGFIQIDGNILRITPVEVFTTFPLADEIAANTIVVFDYDDTASMADKYGITQDDFPSGIHIRPNWHADLQWFYVEQENIAVQAFEITADSEFNFVDNLLLFDTDPDGNRQHITNEVDEFLEYFFPMVVHFIEVRDNVLIRLYQNFSFTF